MQIRAMKTVLSHKKHIRPTKEEPDS